MKDKQNVYGIPRDIFARIKVWGIAFVDIGLVAVTLLVSLAYSTKIFASNDFFRVITFPIVSVAIVGYLLLPANGGKKNYNQLLLSFIPHKSLWISFQR